MVPRPLAPARAMSSRTCADVIQPCRQEKEPFSSPEPPVPLSRRGLRTRDENGKERASESILV